MNPFYRLQAALRCHGLIGTLAAVRKQPLKNTPTFRRKVANRKGLEIGGPSPFFKTFLPIYQDIRSLDNCIFASTTVWEGAVQKEFLYYPTQTPGQNHIAEATDLSRFSDHSYEFVLSCHNLEHIANPIKALKEWLRITVPGGRLILVLPDGHRTFDHRRPITPVSHMLADYERGVDESDLTHLDEILALHDLRRDPGAGTADEFRARCFNNLSLRCLHHHVFDERNSQELLQTAGYRVEAVESARPFHIALLACVPN